MDKIINNNLQTINTLSSIDSLQYFLQTNIQYHSFFDTLVSLYETRLKILKDNDIQINKGDIIITLREDLISGIDELSLIYLGKGESFLWFKDINNNFKIGFKSDLDNRGLYNIRVQLLGNGIYSIGLKNLVVYINNLFKIYTTGYYPITRADLNIFVNYDFSFVTKEMFATRKRGYEIIAKEIGNAFINQTIYIGKKPFLLRIYDKKAELKNSPKKELMLEYFLKNGIDISQPIFNVEFEYHRTFLKTFGIDTIDDLFFNVDFLFQNSMDSIRLIDLSTLSSNALKNNNKNRAKTLPIWTYLKEAYNYDDFLQNDKKLIKVKKPPYEYNIDHCIQEHILLGRKAIINSIPLSKELYDNIYSKVIKSFPTLKQRLENE